MNSVSFILNGDDLQAEQLQSLSEYAKQLQAITSIHSECLVYFVRTSEHKALTGLTYVHSETPGVSSFQKAIVAAAGDNLVFTTPANLLADKQALLVAQAASLAGFMVAAPLKQTRLSSALGLRQLKNTPYVITSKQFAVSHQELIETPAAAVPVANKRLAFVALPPLDFTAPDILTDSLLFGRPYRTILSNIVQVKRQKIHNRHTARRAEKLRQRVPPVPFSADIPVFIICRDRVEPLRKLVSWCEDEGLTNIILLDNASSYSPLLKYYSQTPYEVVHLGANMGHTSPWDSGAVTTYATDKPFIVTDPDIIPDANAHGAVELFCKLLTEHPERTKAGFGLKIDDLPDSYALKSQVLAWEKQFWVSTVEADVYDAEIDTTFAVYRQDTPYTLGPGLRTGGRFIARHEPWYMNSKKPSAEMKYYREHANKLSGTWGIDEKELVSTYAKTS
jgi:hypothetical protein